jgi:hypothetical protein
VNVKSGVVDRVRDRRRRTVGRGGRRTDDDVIGAGASVLKSNSGDSAPGKLLACTMVVHQRPRVPFAEGIVVQVDIGPAPLS